uniref:Uncharacterized protein n=1 Tax=Mycena chlorophos TaxID=658473 RepID=A0ABQ0KZC0_MYCCL|nr:predicted protein [Mycena chlorophos]
MSGLRTRSRSSVVVHVALSREQGMEAANAVVNTRDLADELDGPTRTDARLLGLLNGPGVAHRRVVHVVGLVKCFFKVNNLVLTKTSSRCSTATRIRRWKSIRGNAVTHRNYIGTLAFLDDDYPSSERAHRGVPIRSETTESRVDLQELRALSESRISLAKVAEPKDELLVLVGGAERTGYTARCSAFAQPSAELRAKPGASVCIDAGAATHIPPTHVGTHATDDQDPASFTPVVAAFLMSTHSPHRFRLGIVSGRVAVVLLVVSVVGAASCRRGSKPPMFSLHPPQHQNPLRPLHTAPRHTLPSTKLSCTATSARARKYSTSMSMYRTKDDSSTAPLPQTSSTTCNARLRAWPAVRRAVDASPFELAVVRRRHAKHCPMFVVPAFRIRAAAARTTSHAPVAALLLSDVARKPVPAQPPAYCARHCRGPRPRRRCTGATTVRLQPRFRTRLQRHAIRMRAWPVFRLAADTSPFVLAVELHRNARWCIMQLMLAGLRAADAFTVESKKHRDSGRRGRRMGRGQHLLDATIHVLRVPEDIPDVRRPRLAHPHAPARTSSHAPVSSSAAFDEDQSPRNHMRMQPPQDVITSTGSLDAPGTVAPRAWGLEVLRVLYVLMRDEYS